MKKLIRADIRRLMLCKSFIISVVLTALFEAGFAILLTRNGPMPRDMVLFLSLLFISIFTAVFLSLYLGTEYSDGTMRNKLAIGHTRFSIYCASLITGLFAVTVLFATEIVTGIIIGAILYESPQYGIAYLLQIGLTGWFACAAVVSLYTLIGMLSSGKAVTAISCILISFTMLFLGLFTVRMLGSDNLSDTERQAFQLIYEINPSGQLMQVFTVKVTEPLKLIAYSSIFSALLTVAGVLGFERKDLK